MQCVTFGFASIINKEKNVDEEKSTDKEKNTQPPLPPKPHPHSDMQGNLLA